ncbi:MAG: flagellar hook-basal body complex protein FliE [Acidobacteriia bacterium]|nr:flagellar hook-basal body complex protein FliE [Terriglobia bacterium]
MPTPILPISGAALPDAIRPAGQSQGGGAFQDVFTSAIQNVEAFGQDASASVQRFLSGEGEELHTTIMATQRAELAFDMFLQVRNKVVSAYQEIMRMQM